MVSAADGGVHLAEVATLAVTVSFTEVTEVGVGRDRDLRVQGTGCLSDTALTRQLAVPLPSPQPPAKAASGWTAGRSGPR